MQVKEKTRAGLRRWACAVCAAALGGIAGGATVRVTDFGADPTGAQPSQDAIQRACRAAQKGDTVLFPRGVYALRKNVRLENLQDVTLAGEPGAVIQMHSNPEGPESESSGGLVVNGGRSVRIERLWLTTDNPIGCAGRIVAKDAAARTVDFLVDAACAFTGREHVFQIDTCDEEGAPDRALETHENIHAVTNEAGAVRHEGLAYARLGERLIRLSLPSWVSVQAVTNGHRALLRYSRSGGTAFWISNVRGLTMEDVEISRTAAMGMMIAPGTSDVTLRRFCIRMAADDPALHASNSDGIHVFGCEGTLRLEDCHFKGLGDDAFNVHAMGGEIAACDAAKGTASVILRLVDRQPKPLPSGWARAGDTIDVYDPKTLNVKGSLRLTGYRDGALTFAPVTFRPDKGDIVANVRHLPTVRVTGCSVENTRARAFLLQTRHVSVEGSRFRGFPSPAIIVTSDVVMWNEMAPTVDCEIRDCTFEKCANALSGLPLGAVVVKLNHNGTPSQCPPGAFRNVRIADCRFADIGSSAVYAECTDGLRIAGNVFRRTWARAAASAEGFDIRLNSCARVRLEGNDSDRPAANLVTGTDNSPRLAEVFSDHMVFPAGKELRVFGTGEGAVAVRFGGQERRTVAVRGRWCVTFPAMPAGGPYELEADLGGRRQVVRDVMVGEVLVMAGQSNMQFLLGESTTKERFEDPRIRMFSTTRLERGAVFGAADGWVPLTRKSAWAWTAIGCETAVRRARATGRAVGVICCVQGASVIKTWMPRALARDARFGLDPAKCSHPDAREDAYSLWNRSGTLYESQFAEIAGYPVTSVTWYQGESNSHSVEEGTLYADMLAVLIGQWRADFRDPGLPFYVLQLAADTTGGSNPAAWNAVKASQAKVAETVPGVTLVRTDDICETDKGIHPPTKRLIAERLADAMRRSRCSTRPSSCRSSSARRVRSGASCGSRAPTRSWRRPCRR